MSITVGNVAGHNGGSPGPTTTFSITCNATTLFVAETNAAGAGYYVPTGVTFNGISMTQVYAGNSGHIFGTSGWILTGITNPTTANVVISISNSAGYATAAGISLIGVNQSTPTRTPSTNSSTSNVNATVTPTSSTGDLVVGSCGIYNSTITSGSANGQLNEYTAVIGGIVCGSEDVMNGGSGNAMTWTGSGGGSTEWAAGAVALIPVGSVIPPMIYTKRNYIPIESVVIY